MSSRTPPRRIRAQVRAMTAGLALAALAPTLPAAAEDLVVKYDQSQLLRLPRPVADIIIGNSTIADVHVQAGNLLVITGKTFGITNVIALDAERNVIQDQRVVVVREDARVVNLQKGSKRESYNCTPVCNPSLVVGDDQGYFQTVNGMAERKIRFSESASDGSSAAASGQ